MKPYCSRLTSLSIGPGKGRIHIAVFLPIMFDAPIGCRLEHTKSDSVVLLTNHCSVIEKIPCHHPLGRELLPYNYQPAIRSEIFAAREFIVQAVG
jgi:hypothetical protein